MKLQDLFQDLRVASVHLKRLDQGEVVVVNVESMSQADLINCDIEIPYERRKEFPEVMEMFNG